MADSVMEGTSTLSENSKNVSWSPSLIDKEPRSDVENNKPKKRKRVIRFREEDLHYTNLLTPAEYVTKGHRKHKKSSDITHSNDDDIFSISLEDLGRSIEVLASNHWQNIDLLPDDHEVSKAYQILRLAVTMLEGTDRYKIINKLILKQFRPSELSSGTVGSFLFGCFQESYGDVEKSCSPLCIDGVKSGKMKRCGYQVWIQRNEPTRPNDKSKKNSKLGNLEVCRRFVRIKADEDASKAIIYVNSDFKEFTKNEIDNYRKSGVLMASVMITKGSKHHRVIRMTSVDNLPIEGNKVNSKDNQVSETRHEDLSISDNTTNYGIMLVGVIFLAAVLSIFILSRRSPNFWR